MTGTGAAGKCKACLPRMKMKNYLIPSLTTIGRTGKRMKKTAVIFSIACTAILVFAVQAGQSAAADAIRPVPGKLERYAIDIRQSSVSGLSAGGYLANQFFVAYSGIMSGVGVFAGGPYGCARGSLWKAVKDCMARPDHLTPEAMSDLVHNAQALARDHRIDPLENLKSKKIFLFAGQSDQTVRPAVVDRVYDWYRQIGVPESSIHYQKGIVAGHAMPTMNYGNKCEEASRPPWISACNYDGAGEVLKQIYGTLNPARPKAKLDGRLIEFAQKAYVDPEPMNREDLAEQTGLNEFGYVYVPRSCLDGRVCRIHVVFHGCRQVYNQDPEDIDPAKGGVVFGLQMILHAGYNEWADTNQIIVLYPQAQKTKANPRGCFDWWGYLGGPPNGYLTREAPQMKATRAMMNALGGK